MTKKIPLDKGDAQKRLFRNPNKKAVLGIGLVMMVIPIFVLILYTFGIILRISSRSGLVIWAPASTLIRFTQRNRLHQGWSALYCQPSIVSADFIQQL